MDAIHKSVLANYTGVIMERISNPVVLSGHLAVLFTTSDKEEIEAKTKQIGATVGTQTLLSLLEKRGSTAFSRFINALRNPEIKQEELALELENEDRLLRGKATEVPMRRAQSLGPPCREERLDEDIVVCSPPPPYSAPVRSNSDVYNFSQGQQSPVSKQPPAAEEITSQEHAEQTPEKLTRDSLVKDMPFSLRNKIVKLLNPPDVNSHDWKGLAGAMNLTADDVRQLENDDRGRMAGLFDKMIHTKKTINHLLALLKHKDVERWDVIDEIIKGCNLETESFDEDQESASAVVASSVEESCNPATKSKLQLPFPRQESQDPQEVDTKPDARIPSQVEESHNNHKGEGQAELDAKPDARIPSQVEDTEELDLNSKPGYQFPHQATSNGDDDNDDDDDDVFDCTDDHEVRRHALLISCCGNSKNEKAHDIELRKLEGVLEDSGWYVKRYTKCKVSNLIQTVHSYLANHRESGRIISFVYLVGSTVHINGENYLLPPDLKSPSSQADLMHSSLNVNWLVTQLSSNYMQVVIVDGAHENALTGVNLNGVLQGLAPIHPPPNAVIAFPCCPGSIRPEQERLYYIKSVLKHLSDETVMLGDLFDKVRRDLMDKQPATCSLPVEFSLTSSLLPLCLNPGDSEGPQVPPLGNVTCHAIIVSNSKYDGLSVKTPQCLTDCETLRMALLKAGWNCEEICDKSAKEIMDELREALNKLSDKRRTVMVYFMGYTKMIMDRNYFFGKDFTVGSEPLRSSVPLQWALDLMAEKLKGPKILIVDDMRTDPCTPGLAQMTTPFDVMISLPKEGDFRQYDTSFTNNFAHLMETKIGQLSLKEMIKKAASFDRHRLSSNLFNSQ